MKIIFKLLSGIGDFLRLAFAKMTGRDVARLNSYNDVRLLLIWRIFTAGKISFPKIINAVVCYLRYFSRSEYSGRTPIVINFELWNDCNEACVFCRSAQGEIYNSKPGGAGFIPKGKLPIDVYQSAINQTAETLLLSIPYVNGEPLLSKDIYTAVQYATSRNVATMIATNGMILNKANGLKLLEAGIDFVKIHISGFSQPVHSIQHRKGDVEVIKRNIRDFVESNREGGFGALVMLDYIKYNHNAHEVEAAREFADSLGMIFNLRPGNPRGMEDSEPPQGAGPLPVDVACDWLWTVLTIDWNRKVFPCCDHVVWGGADAYAEFKTGETSLPVLWNDAGARRMRKIHSTEGRAPIPICSECPRQGVTFKW